ncbi:hypothetical protein BJ123_110126 [Rhodopseudomonas thermotolerans]|uniref:Uncharacterized protein n=2 Tax=Rhodopseudomonas TaxID=1073 RepID=A0A336JSA5_9BRAD|nr:hypothetical protein BJ125_110126 [Rhodopseudomonas pentothenatexigens]REG02683.1 hypothetical protein BJ123_110126 [Rhodopseudomonas thermotolerans]SSW91156.1 hypothetical protein SAMN05892882_110126 [Rhodopseudomonas pentothenatexigens]
MVRRRTKRATGNGMLSNTCCAKGSAVHGGTGRAGTELPTGAVPLVAFYLS